MRTMTNTDPQLGMVLLIAGVAGVAVIGLYWAVDWAVNRRSAARNRRVVGEARQLRAVNRPMTTVADVRRPVPAPAGRYDIDRITVENRQLKEGILRLGARNLDLAAQLEEVNAENHRLRAALARHDGEQRRRRQAHVDDNGDLVLRSLGLAHTMEVLELHPELDEDRIRELDDLLAGAA